MPFTGIHRKSLPELLLGLPRNVKRSLVVLADLVLLPLAFWSAVALRFDNGLPDVPGYGVLAVAAPLFAIPLFIVLGLYHAVIRFMGERAIFTVVAGVTISVLLLASLVALAHISGISRGVLFIYWCLAVLYVGASRLLARSYLRRLNPLRAKKQVRVAIYGAGSAGAQLAAAFKAGHEYLPVAFVDDNPDLHGARVSGIPIYAPARLAEITEAHEIEQILLAMPSVSRSETRKILQQLEPLGVKLKTMPGMDELASGKVDVSDLREVGIEDLLGREAALPNMKLLTACVTGKSVLVTGAGGSIGSELCRQIAHLRPNRLILLELSEFALYSIEQELRSVLTKKSEPDDPELIAVLGSVLEQERLTDLMREHGVDTVFHAAAYKHVPIVEHNPGTGVRNNVQGTRVCAEAAIAAEVATFVLISTDKAVRPTNVMGASKRLAELVLQALAAEGKGRTRFTMVRFGNVLGSSGSVVPLFRRQIAAGGPLTLTHPEITRYFMTIPEAAQLVIQAGAMGQGGDVFVLDMGQPVRIIDLARRMIHLSGLSVRDEANPDGDIEIRITGLRPGEKLYEELLIGGEVEPTPHPRIMRSREHMIPWGRLQEMLTAIDAVCDGMSSCEVVQRLLCQAVVEYTPDEQSV